MSDKKIALVTGVTRETGLGVEIARQLAVLGFEVIITGRPLDNVIAAAGDGTLNRMEMDMYLLKAKPDK